MLTLKRTLRHNWHIGHFLAFTLKLKHSLYIIPTLKQSSLKLSNEKWLRPCVKSLTGLRIVSYVKVWVDFFLIWVVFCVWKLESFSNRTQLFLPFLGKGDKTSKRWSRPDRVSHRVRFSIFALITLKIPSKSTRPIFSDSLRPFYRIWANHKFCTR